MTDLLPALRCPSCDATLRAGAPWCTLCYADLRPKPSPVLPPPPLLTAPAAASYGPPALDPLTAPAEALGLPPAVPVPSAASWPCTTCGADNALTDPACTGCGAGFLSGLRDTEAPLLELPVVGDLGRLTRGQRLGLAAATVLAVLALVALLGLLTS